MGKIYDYFKTVKYANEAEVSLKFTVPLLTEFLGFSRDEIIPEHDFPSRQIFYGHRTFSSKRFPKFQRPDYIVCLNGEFKKACFVIDSKGVDEDLDKYLGQLTSYSIGAKVNFLAITNGIALRVYYGQEEVLALSGLEEIDIFFSAIRQLLSKDSHIKKTPLEIIKEFDLKEIVAVKKDISEHSRLRTRLELSDYFEYAKRLENEFVNWQFGNIAENLGVSKVPPQMLHMLKAKNINKEEFKNQLIDPDKLFTKVNSRIKIIYGPSGIGKTTLLRFWAYTQADKCVNLIDSAVPIFIELRNYGLNRSIKILVQNALNKRGYVCSNESLTADLLNKRFIFFFDGFDEIAQNYQSDALSEIVGFSEDFPNHKLIISSRTGIELRIPGSLSFDIQPLDRERVELIVELNLGPRKHEFLNQLYQLGLINEMGNTLLLLLTINVFQKQSTIPVTRTKIIENSIDWLEKWAESKYPKMQSKINFKIKIALLNEAAFLIKQNDFGASLTEPYITKFLSEQLRIYEEAREVEPGLEKMAALKELSTTGFVHIDEYGLSFNSTIFLNYFAATRLSELYMENKDVLNDKIDKLEWHEVIIIAASKLSDANAFIKAIYQQGNILKAAACVIENNGINHDILEKITDDLEHYCSSRFPTVRNRSLYYLSRVDKTFTKKIFQRLADSPFLNVKISAIEELSKMKTSDSYKIVYENLDWDEGGFEIERTTQGAIARSLANLDDEKSHLKIIEIWKKKPDMFTTEDCRLAMLQLVYRNKLTPKIRDALLDYFLSTPPDRDVGYYSRIKGIADVFIALGDESIASKLIDGLTDDEKCYARLYETPKVLSSFKTPTIFKMLVERSLDTQKPPKVRQAMIDALVDAESFKLELPVLEKLLSDEHFQVKRAAIKGLSKYAVYEVKDMLLRLINDLDVGGEATELLGDFGLLTIICENDNFPKQFYPEPLFEQIRKHGLVEFLPILNRFQENWLADKRTDQSERFLIDLAHTYVILGQVNQALQIINSFYVKGKISFEGNYSYAHLAELCPIIGAPQGLKILQDIYLEIEEARKLQNAPKLFDGIYMDDKYIESLEKIGGEEVIELLTSFCEKHINDMLFERAMRAIVTFAPESKEDWLIHLLVENGQLKGAELHRAIEALGVIGTEKAMPLLKKVAKENIGNEYISDTCLRSLEYIYHKKGIVKFLEDKDVLVD